MIGLVGILCGVLLAAANLSGAEQKILAFVPGGTNEFTFDTGVLRGKLRAGGKSTGLSSVIHVPTGARLDASMGLFSHYRLFSANRRYGTAAWDVASQARLAPDGSVEVHWPAVPDRPFDLRAVYRWAAPNILDLETAVKANTNLHHFESFLASYFTPGFTNAAVRVSGAGGDTFLAAEKSAGTWLAFPRNDAAVSIIKDGRWKFEPNPVDWVIMPRLAANLGVRRAPANGLTAILLSPPGDCFAILTPFQTEPHYSMYLCLFGGDLVPGQTAKARARLVIADRPTDADILRLYEDYNGR